VNDPVASSALGLSLGAGRLVRIHFLAWVLRRGHFLMSAWWLLLIVPVVLFAGLAGGVWFVARLVVGPWR
jgi:hypothetical protein